MKRTSIFLPADLHEILRRVAFQRHVTMGELIRTAVMEWLEKEGKLPKRRDRTRKHQDPL